MPEATAMRWSPAQQSMLRELGCELFSVRRTGEEADLGASAMVGVDTDAPATRTSHACAVAPGTRGSHTAIAAPALRASGAHGAAVAMRGSDAHGAAAAMRGSDASDAAVATRSSNADAAASRMRPAGGPAASARPGARRLLVVLSPDANWLRGPHAKLARGVLVALGVSESDVRGEPAPGVPMLAFGLDAPDALCAPAFEALRDARAKRALWPALRALRRRLRAADARG